MGDVQTQITQIIDDYEKIGGNSGIDELLNMSDKLAQLSYHFAEQCGAYKKDYNASYYIEKINVIRSTQGMVFNLKYSVAKAKLKAELENEGLTRKRLEQEGAAYTADLLLRQVNKTLERMSQRISYLKQEQNREQNADLMTNNMILILDKMVEAIRKKAYE